MREMSLNRFLCPRPERLRLKVATAECVQSIGYRTYIVIEFIPRGDEEGHISDERY